MSESVAPSSAIARARDREEIAQPVPLVRGALVVLLLVGAYLAIQPWLSCAFPAGLDRFLPDLARACTFGTGNALADQSGPGLMWWRLVLSAIFLIAGLWLAFTRRLRLVAD